MGSGSGSGPGLQICRLSEKERGVILKTYLYLKEEERGEKTPITSGEKFRRLIGVRRGRGGVVRGHTGTEDGE